MLGTIYFSWLLHDFSIDLDPKLCRQHKKIGGHCCHQQMYDNMKIAKKMKQVENGLFYL